MNTFFLFCLILTYILPIYWILRSGFAYKRRLLVTVHFIYPFFSESILVFLTGHLSYLYAPNPDLSDSSLSTYYIFAILSRIVILIGYYIAIFRQNKVSLLLSDIKIARKFNYSKISIILLISITAWIFASAGYALISPRIAYQEFRSGSGYIWALMVSISTYLAATISLLDSFQTLRNLRSYIILFELAAYASGSKGVILWNNVIAILIAKPSKVIGVLRVKQFSRFKKYITSFIFVPFLLWVFVLFGGSGPDGLFQKLLVT